MICKPTCAIAFIFLLATLYVGYSKPNENIIKPYLATLNEQQKQKYEEITVERRDISMRGYALGFALSLFLILYNHISSRGKIPITWMVCLATATTLIVNYLYYILAPKSDWMVNYLQTPEQKQQWLKVYRTMQFNWHAGLATGLMTIAVLAAAFR